MEQRYLGLPSSGNSVQAVHDILTGKDECRAVEMFRRLRTGANGSMDEIHGRPGPRGAHSPMGTSG